MIDKKVVFQVEDASLALDVLWLLSDNIENTLFVLLGDVTTIKSDRDKVDKIESRMTSRGNRLFVTSRRSSFYFVWDAALLVDVGHTDQWLGEYGRPYISSATVDTCLINTVFDQVDFKEISNCCNTVTDTPTKRSYSLESISYAATIKTFLDKGSLDSKNVDKTRVLKWYREHSPICSKCLEMNKLKTM